MSKNDPIEVKDLTRIANELLVLNALSGESRHGYQIVLDIETATSGYFSFNHGTLYPILHKLEKAGLIAGAWEEGTSLRKRKFYRITPEGSLYLKELKIRWGQFGDHLDKWLEEK